MTVDKQFENLWQGHAEVSVIEASGEQRRVGTEGWSNVPVGLRRPEEHLRPNRLEAVATAHAVDNLRQPVQRLGECVGDPAIEVVEDLGSPVVNGSDQFGECGPGRRIEARLPGVVEFGGFSAAIKSTLCGLS